MLNKILPLSLFFLLIVNASSAQQDSLQDKPKKVRTYTTTRLTTAPPVIDGVLDDICWQVTGEWAGDYVQWIPKEGAKPTHPTHLKILYDNKSIYVAIKAFDEPDKIISRLCRRDEFNGDVVGINFDSYHDHRTGFEFNITAAGQKVDLLLTNPSNGDYNWNAVWNAKTALNDSGWTAEYEIPLSQLRYSSDSVQVWGMHSWRWIDRLQEESDWEPQSSTGPGILYLFGELHGISGLPSSRRIEIMPYTLGKLNTFQKENGNPFADEGRSWWGNAGIDAKIGLSSNFTADLTINPDFGQVESDPSVMNLSVFETYYDEKRPFFLEGKNIFSFDFDDVNLFYTRRIGHTPSFSPALRENEYLDAPENTTILSAVKLSGKTAGGLSVGVLQSITAGEQADINYQGIKRELAVEPVSSYTIARLQQDYSEGNTVVGGMFTSANRFIKDPHLEFLSRNAFTGGIDFLHYWNDKEFFVDAKVVGSSINGTAEAITLLQNSSARFYQRPGVSHLNYDENRTSLSGHGGSIKVGKGSKGLWRYSTEINWRSPGLELNDIGYMQTADIFKQEAAVSFFVNQPVGIFRTYNIELEQGNYWDYGMNYLVSDAELTLYGEFLNNWAVRTTFEYDTENLETRILRGGPAMLIPPAFSGSVYMRTDPSAKVSFSINSSYTEHFDNAYKGYSIEPAISVVPLSNLKLSGSVNYSDIESGVQYVSTQYNENQDTYILGRIKQKTLGVTFRIDYNITPELSIQFYGSPFASVGNYSEFKAITNPQAKEFADRFSVFAPVLTENIYNYSDGNINYSFANPDFNFSQFRSNLVLRWEYLPGSQVYLVWSNERTHFLQPGKKSVTDEMNLLKDIYPSSIFLLKFNYWFTI